MFRDLLFVPSSGLRNEVLARCISYIGITDMEGEPIGSFLNPDDGTKSKSRNVGFLFLIRRRVITQKEDNFNTMNHGESLKFNIQF